MSQTPTQAPLWTPEIRDAFCPKADAVILSGNSAETLKTLPAGAARLIMTLYW